MSFPINVFVGQKAGRYLKEKIEGFSDDRILRHPANGETERFRREFGRWGKK